jgi:hypothetical protein
MIHKSFGGERRWLGGKPKKGRMYVTLAVAGDTTKKKKKNVDCTNEGKTAKSYSKEREGTSRVRNRKEVGSK